MNKVRDLHNEAMELAQLALIARESGDLKHAEVLAEKAFILESEAASLIDDDLSSEPTRSILYRSAASLAYQAKKYDIAIKLAAKGLSGSPPNDIYRDLRKLYELITFEQHLLDVYDDQIDDSVLEISMNGNSIGPGIIYVSDFLKRMENIRTIIERTTQRLMGRQYQSSGRPADIYKPYQPIIEIPTQNSFAINLKLIRSAKQLVLSPTIPQVIEDILTGFEHLYSANEDQLRALIPDTKYYNGFVTLARDIAPDGDRISSILLSSKQKVVSLTKQREEIQLQPIVEEIDKDTEMTPIRVIGILDFASARGTELMGLTTEEKKEYDIVVSEGFEDLVRSYFKQMVEVRGKFDGKKKIHLSDIKSAE